jgi:hypothetical protein
VPLGAVTDDGHLLGLDQAEVGIVIVISLCHDFSTFPLLDSISIPDRPIRQVFDR